jgi:hypothetical protein
MCSSRQETACRTWEMATWPYQPRAIGTDLEHMHQASQLVASLSQLPGGLNAASFMPLPSLASDMQSPRNGMQPLHHLRNGPVGVALPVVQAVGAALAGVHLS